MTQQQRQQLSPLIQKPMSQKPITFVLLNRAYSSKHLLRKLHTQKICNYEIISIQNM